MIRGAFDGTRFYPPLPVVSVRVSLPGLSPFPALIDFVIDTGAMVSTLHPADMVEHFRVLPTRLADPSDWPRHDTGLGIGGRAVSFIERARFAFERDDGTSRVLDQEIHIAQSTDTNEGLPSLLGWDVLRYFRLTLDVRTGIVLLDV